MPQEPVKWDPVLALKGAAWEEAKGKLRALVAIQGSFSSVLIGDETNLERQRWLDLSAQVEDFIRDVEDEGLHE